MSLLNDRPRHELYVGAFYNHSWTIQSLCNYFHRLIEGSNIIDCHFYPCTNPTFEGLWFSFLNLII